MVSSSLSVLSAVAEIERENIIEQTMNGRKEKARQGGWNGGFALMATTSKISNFISKKMKPKRYESSLINM